MKPMIQRLMRCVKKKEHEAETDTVWIIQPQASPKGTVEKGSIETKYVVYKSNIPKEPVGMAHQSSAPSPEE